MCVARQLHVVECVNRRRELVQAGHLNLLQEEHVGNSVHPERGGVVVGLETQDVHTPPLPHIHARIHASHQQRQLRFRDVVFGKDMIV